MPVQEGPVQGGERAGLGTDALGRTVAAALAVVAHAVDVLPAGNVGFAGEAAAVGVQRHAGHVGQLHPLDGVHIDRQVPVGHRARVDLRQQRELAGQHEALDVVRITVPQGLADGVAQAGHVGLARPVPGGQRALVPVVVGLAQARHLLPVDAADEFAPAQHLAHEAFHAGQRQGLRSPFAVGGLDGIDHLARVDQVQVQGHRQQGVPAEGGVAPHRVLIGTEADQALVDEVGQGLQALLPGHRPDKFGQRAGVARKLALDELQDLAGGFVRLEACRRRDPAWPGLRVGLAVVSVEIPLPAQWLVPIHEDTVLTPHLAVEVLHAPLAATTRPACKALAAAQEVGVGVPVQGHPGLGRAGFDGLFKTPLARFAHMQGPWLQDLQLGSQPLVEPMAAGGLFTGVVQADMDHRPAQRTQSGTEMPHGRQEQRDAGLVAPDQIGLARGLDQQDTVERRIETVQGRVAHPELVTEDQHQPAHRRWGHTGPALRQQGRRAGSARCST
jgi:hypothetical protein